MRNFPTKEALVRAYWRKLTSSIEVAYKSRGRVSARRRGAPVSNSSGSRLAQRGGYSPRTVGFGVYKIICGSFV